MWTMEREKMGRKTGQKTHYRREPEINPLNPIAPGADREHGLYCQVCYSNIDMYSIQRNVRISAKSAQNNFHDHQKQLKEQGIKETQFADPHVLLMASTQTNNVSAGNTDLTDSKTARSVMFQPKFNEPALQYNHFSCIAASPMWASRASSHHIPLFSALFACKDALCTIFFAKMTSDKKVNFFYSIPKKF